MGIGGWSGNRGVVGIGGGVGIGRWSGNRGWSDNREVEQGQGRPSMLILAFWPHSGCPCHG